MFYLAFTRSLDGIRGGWVGMKTVSFGMNLAIFHAKFGDDGSLKFIQLLGEPIDVNRSPIKDYVLPTLVLLTFREHSCILTLGEVNLYFPNR